MSTPPLTTIEALVTRARASARAGDARTADRDFGEVLARAPDSIEALHHLGLRALGEARTERALELLGRARDLAPGDAMSCRNAGLALRAAGRLDEAAAAFTDAVRIDPDFFLARLQLGSVFEALGREREAAAAYFGAISTAQRLGRWRNAETTAPAVRPLVEHALAVVDHGRAQLFSEVLEPLRARHGMAELRRVEKCLATYLGALPAEYPDARQKPSFLYFPDLPTRTYFDRDLFPWYAMLEDRAAQIRAELDAVLGEERGFEPFLKFKPGASTEEHLSGTRGTPNWDGFFFYRHGTRYDDNCRRCPITAAALDAVPLVRLRGHAPECLYSKLTPGSHIRPHRGVTNTRVVTHLPLIVPGDGALRVGGEDHAWQEGRCITFDDTFLHEAWNHSERTRVVVLLDVWNPYMTAIEIDAFSELVLAIRDFNVEARLADPLVDAGHA